MARMKKTFLTLLLLAQSSVCLYAQQTADSVNAIAKALQKTGSEYYMKGDGEQAIKAFTQAHDLFLQNNNTKARAICLHSIAFAYDELLQDYRQALIYTEKSIAIHRDIGHTLEMANMIKYLGYLKGRLNRHNEALKDIDSAIQLFSTQKHNDGVAVCWNVMAGVFEQENKPDSAIFYYEKAKKYWDGQCMGRVFNINNKLIPLYRKRPGLATIITENEEMLVQAHFYHTDVLSFYKYCIEHYSRNNNTGKVDSYKSLYKNLTDSLVGKGIVVE